MRLIPAFVLAAVLALYTVPALAQDEANFSPITGAFGLELGQVLEGNAGAAGTMDTPPLTILQQVTTPSPSRHFSFYNLNICTATRQIVGIIGIETFADMDEAQRSFKSLWRILEEKYGPSVSGSEKAEAYQAGEPSMGRAVTLNPPEQAQGVIKVSIQYYDNALWDACLDQEYETQHAEDMDNL